MAGTKYEAFIKGESLRFSDLPKTSGGQVTLWDYQGRQNLVLFFMPRSDTQLIA